VELTMTNTPFQMQQGGNWSTIWETDQGQPIQFQKYWGPGVSQSFLPLGDAAFTDSHSSPWLYAPGPAAPNALAHPIDFTWILDDAGSGNPQSIDYWWPIAPSGYVAMGVCFAPKDVKPDPGSYWCVHQRHCVPAPEAAFWNDQGQGWKHHNGNLLVPTMPTPAPPNGFLTHTLLSAEAMENGMGAPYVLSWT
jgi:hypothetical protein